MFRNSVVYKVGAPGYDPGMGTAEGRKASVYDEITEQVVAMLHEGVAPWQRPWDRAREMPRRINGEPYEGINVFLLLYWQRQRGFKSNLWLTRNKIEAKGGRIKDGERSYEVIFWKPLTVADKNDPDAMRTIPLLRFYSVFNLDQTEGIKSLPRWYREQASKPAPSPIERAEEIVKGYATASYGEGGTRAFYRPSSDHIQMPPRESFRSASGWYATRFHEMGHSTGHKDRLNRPGITELSTSDTSGKRYGREELIAEMTAAFLCGEAGILDMQIQNSAAYLGSWVRTLRDDVKMVVVAASAAQKAADYILGRQAASQGSEQGVPNGTAEVAA